MSKSETIRRRRLGDLRSLLRARCGHTLPDDDAGREYLWELLLPVSLGAEPARKMAHVVEVWARWMGADEARQLIDQINRTPAYLRKPTARELGERLRVTNQERERLKLWTIIPFDMTDAQLKEQRRAKDRARRQRRRRAAGSKPRKAYLAKSLSKKKPWEAQGICRRTWERRRGNHRVASPSAVKLTYSRRHTCDTEQGERPEGLAKGNGEDRKTVSTARGFAS